MIPGGGCVSSPCCDNEVTALNKGYMFIQVQNQKLKRNNQFRVQTMPAGIKEIQSRGWNVDDCKFREIRDELVKNNYNILDGRNNTRGKQFKNRANKTHRVVSL